MTIRMALAKSAVVMEGLSGTIISTRNVVEIVQFSQMTRARIVKKNTTISIGEMIEGQSQVKVKKMLLMLAGDSVRQRKRSGKMRRKGGPKRPVMPMPTKRRSVRRYSMSLMSSLTSRGKPPSQVSHEMTQ